VDLNVLVGSPLGPVSFEWGSMDVLPKTRTEVAHHLIAWQDNWRGFTVNQLGAFTESNARCVMPVLFCPAVHFDVQKCPCIQYSLRVFVLMPFDVMGYDLELTLSDELSYCIDHVIVSCGGGHILWSEEALVEG
jgi:hypothetical protein